MRRLVMTACLLKALLVVLIGQSAMAEDLTGLLTVEISGLKDAEGHVYIAVFNSEDTWLGKNPFAGEKVAIAEALDGDLVRTDLQLPVGTYGISVFYDADHDGELDTNLIGIPKEPIAMSNNAMGKFGPPKWEDALFTVDIEPSIQHIVMKEL